MKSKLLSAFLLSSFASADAEKSIPETLQDALYAEEVSRDNEAAAKQYEEVISRYQAQREFAATALFRLAEVRRKQDRKDDAIKLYQQLITEFPASEKQVSLAKEHLTALGAEVPAPKTSSAPLLLDDDSKELARIRSLETTSPDRMRLGELLVQAAAADQIKTATYLLQKGADPNALGVGNYKETIPLSSAAYAGNLAMCEQLLNHGADVNGKKDIVPLYLAVRSGNLRIVEFLLSRKADPNRRTPHFPMTALALAAQDGHSDIVDSLLKAGADVNLTTSNGWTPLALALSSRKSNAGIVARLLEVGAKADIPIQQELSVDQGANINALKIPKGQTAVDLAVRFDSPELERMIASAPKSELDRLLGGAVEAYNIPAVRLLLKKGADPNAKSRNGVPVVIRATREIIPILLTAGADPNAFFEGRDAPDFAQNPQQYGSQKRSALRSAAESGEKATFDTLIAAGAVPDQEWLDAYLGEGSSEVPNSSLAITDTIIKRFIVPALLGGSGVTFVTSPFVQKPVILQTKSGETPNDLARLLLEPESRLLWPHLSTDAKALPTSLAIWRKGPDGKPLQVWSGDIGGLETFPPLSWGDVISASNPEPFTPGNYSFRDELPPELIWNLRRRISFPITFEIDGTRNEYQVRGDRLVFDPTKAELPLANVGLLAPLFISDDRERAEMIVSRKGWPDIRLDGSLSRSFSLKPGDTIRMTTRSKENQNIPTSSVTVRAVGSYASRTYPTQRYSTSEPIPAPSLLQIIADLLAIPGAPASDSPPDKVVGRLLDCYLPKWDVRTLWNNPDLSNIRIHRPQKDSGVQILVIDLASKIAGTTGNESAEVIRKLDVPLDAGDIVEIILKGNDNWKGLDDKEQTFFAKALNCRIQFVDSGGKIDLKEIHFGAQRYTNTEAGKLPLTVSPNSFPTFRSREVLAPFGYSPLKVVRDGKQIVGTESMMIFLHDGDQVTGEKIQEAVPRPAKPPVIVPSGVIPGGSPQQRPRR